MFKKEEDLKKEYPMRGQEMEEAEYSILEVSLRGAFLMFFLDLDHVHFNRAMNSMTPWGADICYFAFRLKGIFKAA